MEKIDLDKILSWNKFQTLSYLLLGCVIMFSVCPMSYIFSARDIKYRCRINSCDKESDEYNPEWLKNAVPYRNEYPIRCLYYQPSSNNTCTDFNKNKTHSCSEFVFERKQTTIVQDFDITCDENLWKLTIVGTLNGLGELVCIPFAGFLSDRYGRKLMVMVSIILSTLLGLIRSFSFCYYFYASLEFLDAALSSGIYSGVFILALEIVDSKSRSLGNTILSCSYCLGLVVLGTVAWLTPTWRVMSQILYTPGICFAIVCWFVPESVRWLLSQNQTKKAYAILKSISKLNGVELNPEILDQIKSLKNFNEQEKKQNNSALLNAIRSRTLLLRMISCSYIWFSCNFAYNGMTIQSVSLSQDTYLNFILVSVIGIPAYFACHFSMSRFGRRKTLAVSLLLSGIFCICIYFFNTGRWIILTIFLCGKFFVELAYTALYIYTAEMFPTKSRHSIFATCSMVGRLGSLVAPQVPLLARVFSSLPSVIFSILTLSSGILAFQFPETLNLQLPDEIAEAANIEENTSRTI